MLEEIAEGVGYLRQQDERGRANGRTATGVAQRVAHQFVQREEGELGGRGTVSLSERDPVAPGAAPIGQVLSPKAGKRQIVGVAHDSLRGVNKAVSGLQPARAQVTVLSSG